MLFDLFDRLLSCAHIQSIRFTFFAGLSLRAVTRNTCYGLAHTTVTGVDVYCCCICATLNLHTYCTGTGDN